MNQKWILKVEKTLYNGWKKAVSRAQHWEY